MTDNELIQNIKNGNEESFGLLIDRYGGYVAAVVSGVCGGQLTLQDIEELAADVFIAFWNKANQFDESQPIKPYLAKIARNKTVSGFRKNLAIPGGTELSLDEDIMILEKDTTDELAVKREQETILNCAVGNLPQPDKEIFVRFYFFGEKINEIAARMRNNPSTIKTKLRRSRERLRKAFEERGYTYYEG